MSLQERVDLPGSHPAAIAGASAPRPVDDHELIQVTVVLRRRVHTTMPAAEQFAYRNAHTTNYHSRAEFAVLHCADAADIALIDDFAHEYGLTVSERSAARRSVVLRGTVANMQEAFGTSLARYDTPAGAVRGRTGPVTIPASLQGVVTAVLGLDNRPVAKPHVRMGSPAKA